MTMAGGVHEGSPTGALKTFAVDHAPVLSLLSASGRERSARPAELTGRRVVGATGPERGGLPDPAEAGPAPAWPSDEALSPGLR